MSEIPTTGRELRSRVSPEGRLEVSLARVAVRVPGPGEVLVRIEAAPMNPTDLSLLLGSADPSLGEVQGEGDDRRVGFPLDAARMDAMRPRLDLSLSPGLEGAGTVIAAGAGVEHLSGRTVALFGGAMFADYRTISVADCIVPRDGTSAADAASAFVNPQTALGMIDTLHREGHRAMVFTAGASNLGQMLNRASLADGIDVVNIVRRDEHVDILRALGARYVCNSAAPDFADTLAGMIRATGATLGFDAIGGGGMAATILRAMEQVFQPATFSIYGSTVRKKVYVYGRLDPGAIEIGSGTGMAWDVGGWLMGNHLAAIGPEAVGRMRHRIVGELDTTFASAYTGSARLADLLDPAVLARLSRRSTGGKYLITP